EDGQAVWESGEETREEPKPAVLAAEEKPAGNSLRGRVRRLFARPQAQPERTKAPSITVPAHTEPYLNDPPEDNLDEPAPFYIIVLDTGVLTLHFGNLPHVRNTIGRLLLDEELVALTPDYITYLLLDDITDTLVPTTRLLELEVDAIDELVLILTRAEHDDVLKRIGIERRHALWLVRLLHGKAEVLRAIERRILTKMGVSQPGRGRPLPSSEDEDEEEEDEDGGDDELLNSQLLTSDEEEGDLYGWSRRAVQPGASRGGQTMQSEVTKYLADVHDHLIALTASVHHCERILARAHGNYLARINLELTHASNTTNQLATQMTVLAGIFLPLNLVAGIFGMNVKVPGRDRDDLRDFGLILGAMAAFVVISLVVCRWRRII
ncbi:CorA metal ion transporter, partial [Coemansia sp. RSA 2607]